MATKTFDHLPETELVDFLNIFIKRTTSPEKFKEFFTQKIAGD